MSDPYRWLEDASAPATQEWSAAQDALFEASLGELPGRELLQRRLTELLGAGVIGGPVLAAGPAVLHAPHGRAGACRAAHRRPRRHGADAHRPGRPRPLRDDDPGRVAALEGGRPAGLPALGGRHRGVGAVRDGRRERHRGRGTHRPHALLPRRLAARRGGLLLRPPRRARRPSRRTSSSSTAGCGCTASAPTRSRTCWCSATGWTRPTTTASASRWTADGCPSAPPRAPRRATTSGSPTSRSPPRRRRSSRWCSRASTPARRCTSGATAGPTCSPTAMRPRGRLAVTTPDDTSYDAWTDLVPEDVEAVLEGYAILDGAELADPVLLCSWTRHAMSEVTVHDLRTGRADRNRAAARPRLRRRAVRAARGWPRGMARLHRPRHAVLRVPLRRDDRRDLAVGDRAGHRRGPRGACAPDRVHVGRRHDRAAGSGGADQGARPRRARPCSTGTAGSACRSRRATPPGCWRGSRRAASTPSPTCAAARRRARTGTAPACASTSRTCSTTSTRRRSG